MYSNIRTAIQVYIYDESTGTQNHILISIPSMVSLPILATKPCTMGNSRKMGHNFQHSKKMGETDSTSRIASQPSTNFRNFQSPSYSPPWINIGRKRVGIHRVVPGWSSHIAIVAHLHFYGENHSLSLDQGIFANPWWAFPHHSELFGVCTIWHVL